MAATERLREAARDELAVRLPVMTKAELMSQFDDVITDRRLTLRRIQAHLDASKTSASLLLDEHVCLATGGSSGVRAVFVQTIGEFMDYMASFMRPWWPPR